MAELSSRVDKLLEDMVENTIMIITNDLPSLLAQEDTYKIRRHHKDDILKNLPQAKAEILKLVEQEIRAGQERRIRQNKSLCGCPFCTHHTEPYELHVQEDKLNKESLHD